MRQLQTLELRFDSSAVGAALDALIPATLATTAPVVRYGTCEVLDCSPAGVDLSRAPLPLIVAHDQSRLAIGVVEQVQALGDRVTGMVRFGLSPEAQQVRADVVAGIHSHVSVGYLTIGEGVPIDGGFKYRWQPHEVSIVAVPADPAAGFFRSHSGVTQMPQLATAEAQAITELCQRHSLASLAPSMITRNLNLSAAREELLEELARRDLAAGGHLNIRPENNSTADERTLIENTLVARMGGRVEGNVIMSTDCVGLAVRALALSGERVADSDSRDRILQRAFFQTTSDFPRLLGDAVGRVLHQAYAQAPAALKAVARLANLPDFRTKSVVRLGNAPSLEAVGEHGEFKYGAVNEEANTWKLTTFGRIIGLSRQALVNDDLAGFAGMLTKFGEAASRREAEELVNALLSPPQVDGAALFSTGRSTLITDALGLPGLGKAVLSLRQQKEMDGGLITQEPGTIVVPSALEMSARQLAATFTPAQAGDVQPFSLRVVVEPRLDAASATAWYLVAANQSALEYGYLDGEEGVQTMQREGFEIDGLEIKARLDFGTGWVAPVGWVKSTGAGA